MEKASWWNEKLWNSRFPSPSPDGGIHYTTHNTRSSQEAEGTGNCQRSEELTPTPSIRKPHLFGITNAETTVAPCQLSLSHTSPRQSVSRPVISSFRPATPNRHRPLGALRILYLSRHPTASSVGELTNRCMDVCRWSIDNHATEPSGSSVETTPGHLNHQDCGNVEATDIQEIPIDGNDKSSSKSLQQSNQSGEPITSAFKEKKRILLTKNEVSKNEATSFSTVRRPSSAKIVRGSKLTMNSSTERSSDRKPAIEAVQEVSTAVSCFSPIDETVPRKIYTPKYDEHKRMLGRARTGSAESAYSFRGCKCPSSLQEFNALEDSKKGSAFVLSVTPIVFQSPKSANQAIRGLKTDTRKSLSSTFRLHRDSSLLNHGVGKSAGLNKSDGFQRSGGKQNVYQDVQRVKWLEGKHNLPVPPSSACFQKFTTATMYQKLRSQQREGSFANEWRASSKSATPSTDKRPEDYFKEYIMEQTFAPRNKTLLPDTTEVKHEPVIPSLPESHKESTDTTRSTAQESNCATDETSDLEKGNAVLQKSPRTPSTEGSNEGSVASAPPVHDEEVKTEVTNSPHAAQTNDVLPLANSKMSRSVSSLSTVTTSQPENQRFTLGKLLTVKKLLNKPSPLDQAEVSSLEQPAVNDVNLKASEPLITEIKKVVPSQEMCDDKNYAIEHLIEETPYPDVSSETPPSFDEEKECEDGKRWDSIDSLTNQELVVVPDSSFEQLDDISLVVTKPPMHTPKIPVKSILKRSSTLYLSSPTELGLVEDQQPSSSLQSCKNPQLGDRSGRYLSRRTCSARPSGGRMMPMDEPNWMQATKVENPSAATYRGSNLASAKTAGSRSAVRFDMKNNLVFEFHPLDFVHDPHT